MPRRRQIAVIIFVLLALAVFLTTIARNLGEMERRSLQLKETPVADSWVGVSFQIVSVNMAASEMTARVSIHLNGDLTKDLVTPSVDLKLFLNGIHGPQEFDLPRGRRINPITAVFALDGNPNHYPFDRYSSSLRVIVTKKTPARRSPPPSEQPSPSAAVPDESDEGFLTAAGQEGELLTIGSSINASTPGVKFEGEHVERPEQGIEGFNLNLRRADNVIVVSVLTMSSHTVDLRKQEVIGLSRSL